MQVAALMTEWEQMDRTIKSLILISLALAIGIVIGTLMTVSKASRYNSVLTDTSVPIPGCYHSCRG